MCIFLGKRSPEESWRTNEFPDVFLTMVKGPIKLGSKLDFFSKFFFENRTSNWKFGRIGDSFVFFFKILRRF